MNKRTPIVTPVEEKDITCLAEGHTFPVDQQETGINENQIVVGSTGCGKTKSVVEPLVLHTFDRNIILNITKRTLFDKYAPIFKARGYKVWDLNLAEPEKSNVSYDPMDFVTTEKEAHKLAQTLVGSEESRNMQGNTDPYWNQSGISGLAAIIDLAMMNARTAGRKARFSDVVQLFRRLHLNERDGKCSTTLDSFFDAAESRYPGNQATILWNTLRQNGARTAYCIYSIMSNAMDKIMDPEAMKMMQKKQKISFEKLGSEKVILFVTTSPVNKAMEKLSTMLFADAFRALFEYAESLPGKELPVHTHIICDDFATGSKIPDFAEYISVFRAAGISVTLLLQSESQLEGMYDKCDATTIINNCDTYVYLGGMDNATCTDISKKLNVPFEDVVYMPLEQVVVFRRGSKPIVARRYQTYQDPLYLKYFSNYDQDRPAV